MKKLKTLLFLIPLFFIFANGALAQTFSFTPEAATKEVDEEFTVNINIDAGTQKINGADLKMTYDEDLLDVKVERGDFFPAGGFNIEDGIIYISYGIDRPLVTNTVTSGVFAKLTLKGKKAGEATLTVVCSGQKEDSNIWDENKNDVIDCTAIEDPMYTIISAGSSSEGATVSATPTVRSIGGAATATPPVSGVSLPTVFSIGAGVILTVLGLALII